MRALYLSSVPGSPQVGDVPTPVPQGGELLVKVASGSLNGVDAVVSGGGLQGWAEHRFPLVLGKDFAGVVEGIGDGVTGFAVGDHVFGVVTKPFFGDGSLGEYVTVPAEVGVTYRPDELAVREAGAVGLAGATALVALDALALVEGETVLVSGATGGVGAIAVQYAIAAGTRVIATARDERQRDFLASLTDGPIEFADYSVGLSLSGVDVAVHLAGDGAEIESLVKDGGRIASTLGFAGNGERGLTVHAIATVPERALLDRLATDVVKGALRVPVTAAYALDQAHQAIQDFAAGALGKLAITI